MRTARNAAVGGEINQLAQALASFKARYGDYPPSRIFLSEDGNLLPPQGSTQIAPGDITYAQLGQRSIAAMRKFFPRVTFNLANPTGQTGHWYDFNGDGQPLSNGVVQQYILHGHECLVFFLGGVPVLTNSGYGMTGFGKDPTNPFTNSVVLPNGNPGPGYSGNRQAPFFEFIANRLVLDPADSSGIPGYLDSLGNAPPQATSNPLAPSTTPINFYAYFSAYGNGGYDPNDVNFVSENYNPISLTYPELAYNVNFPVTGATSALSPAPNPYTSTFTVLGPGTPAVTFLNPQSFQIISSGVDGTYGVGGQYSPDSSEALPYDATNNPYLQNTIGNSIRVSERDNVTNFHNGKLE